MIKAMTKTAWQTRFAESQRLVQADEMVPQDSSLLSWSAEYTVQDAPGCLRYWDRACQSLKVTASCHNLSGTAGFYSRLKNVASWGVFCCQIV